MKNITLIVLLLISFSANAKKHKCNVEQGQFNEAFKAIVETHEETPYLHVGESILSPCESTTFDKELSDYILANKLDSLKMFLSEEHTQYIEAKKYWTQLHKQALNGTLVMCQPDPVSKIGFIVKQKNSFFVMEGGNAYFELTPATCTK